jgi:hypothetical protein
LENLLREWVNSRMPSAKERRLHFLSAMSLAIGAGFLVVGLWPFNFHSMNGVRWLGNADGIRFQGRGIAYTDGPVGGGEPTPAASSGGGSMSLSLWVRPQDEPGDDIKQILSFHSNGVQTFLLGQWLSFLIVKFPCTNATHAVRLCEFDVPNALERGRLTFITLVAGPDGSVIYADGAPKSSTEARLLTQRSIAGTLVAGNSMTGKTPWQGELTGLAFGPVRLTASEVAEDFRTWRDTGYPGSAAGHALEGLYLFNERSGSIACSHAGRVPCFQIPRSFKVLRRVVLEWPRGKDLLSHWNLEDVLVNLAGFVPFGFFVCAYFCESRDWSKRRIVLITTLWGGAISLTIELLQVYLPTRDSSSEDLTFNILGSLLGATVLSYARTRFQKTE